MSYDSYQGLVEVPETLASKIAADDNLPLTIRVLGYEDNQLSPVPLSELLESAEYEEFAQFEIIPSKVVSFLTEKNNGFLHIHKMLKPILFANYIGGEPVIVGGRHRVTGLATVYEQKGIPSENVTVYVQRLEVDSLEQLLQLVQADNASRSMTATEKLTCLAQTLSYDVEDPSSIISALFAPTNTRLTLGQVAKLIFPLIYGGEVELTNHTLGQIGTAFASSVSREHGKAVKQYKLWSESFVSAMLNDGVEILERTVTSLDVSNVARAATQIGRDIASKFEADLLNLIDEAKVAFEEAEAERQAEKEAKAVAAAAKKAEKAAKDAAKAEKEAAKAEALASTPTAKAKTAKPKAAKPKATV